MTSTAQTATTSQARIKALEEAIHTMDGLATHGLRQIAGIAKLALAALEAPATYSNPENLAQTLNAIWWIAEHTDQCFSDTAKEAGSDYQDKSAERRCAAFFNEKVA